MQVLAKRRKKMNQDPKPGPDKKKDDDFVTDAPPHCIGICR
jgi:hypothetical protein